MLFYVCIVLKLMSFLDRFVKLFDITVSKNFDESLTIAFGKLESFKNQHDTLTKELRAKSSKNEHYEQKYIVLKEQMANKEVHMELLRKKLTDLEEMRLSRSEIKVETDEHVHLNKTLEYKVTKLSEQVKCLKAQNTELKASILDLSNTQVGSILDAVFEIDFVVFIDFFVLFTLLRIALSS